MANVTPEKVARVVLAVGTGLTMVACTPASTPELASPPGPTTRSFTPTGGWQELVRSSFQANVFEEEKMKKLVEAETAGRIERRAIDLALAEKEALAKKALVESVYQKLNVREALSIVRDEIWGEGTIAEGEFSLFKDGRSWLVKGLVLTSEPVPHVTVDGRGKDLEMKVNVAPGPSFKLSVAVTPVDLAQKPMVYVQGNLVDESSLMIKHEGNLNSLVGAMGTSRGIDHFYSWWPFYEPNLPIDPEDENARGKFAGLILKNAQGGKGGELPRDIRRYSERSIDLIPGLRERGSLNRADLLDWESQVMGRPKIASMLASIWE